MRKKELAKYQKQVLNALNNHDGDKDKPFLVANRKTYTINEIIKEVENLTDFGLVQIRSWVRVNERIQEVLKKNK